jgi:hypothetical protein
MFLIAYDGEDDDRLEILMLAFRGSGAGWDRESKPTKPIYEMPLF